MSLKCCFQLSFICKYHPSRLPSPPCQLWTWPGWPRYLSLPGWILPWFTVFKTGHETDGQILTGSDRNCFMLWDMSSDVQAPLLVMGILPNTVRLYRWPISHHLSLGTGQLPNVWMKHLTSVTSVEMRYSHDYLWIFHLQLQKHKYLSQIAHTIPLPTFPLLSCPPFTVTMNWEASFSKKFHLLGTIRAWHQRNNTLFCPSSSSSTETEWSEMKMLAVLVFPSWCTTTAP